MKYFFLVQIAHVDSPQFPTPHSLGPPSSISELAGIRGSKSCGYRCPMLLLLLRSHQTGNGDLRAVIGSECDVSGFLFT